MAQKDVLDAWKAQSDTLKAEKTMADAVGMIVDTLISNEDRFVPNDMHSILIRLENMLKAMRKTMSDADALVDPEILESLEGDVAGYRHTLGID